MEQPFEALARLLEVVASPTRLELLHALRTPRSAAQLRVRPSRSRAGEHPGRPLARQTVDHHLDQLLAAGMLRRVPMPGERGEGLVLDHGRLFALVDEVRNLARLRPLHAGTGPAGATLDRAARRGDAGLPPRPRLTVAFGQEDGAAYALAGPGRAWSLGRGPECHLCLDWDPFASAAHCEVTREPSGFRVRDLGSRNGTWVDWERLAPGAAADLAPGSLLLVGRTVLVLQA